MRKQRIRHSGGYVLVHEPDHPKADKFGYVYEHRLIMERKLGRLLRTDELVHHKNEDKGDNREENLEVVTAKWHVVHHIANRPDLDDDAIAALAAAGTTYREFRRMGVSNIRIVRVKRERGMLQEGLKSHCKHGHEFTAENTRVTRRGERACRTCARESMRRQRAKAAA